MPNLNRTRLSLHQFEDRVVPTTGIAWPDTHAVTLSFVPDGTGAGGENSKLFQHLDSQFHGNRDAWQRQIAEAYQTWVVEANVNIGAVVDGGQAMGIAGPTQHDARFGDIRIGARSLSPTNGEALAVSSGYDLSGSTWTGDVLVNTQFQFTEGKRAGKFDLFSTVIQEAGHTLGLLNSTDTKSVMYETYKFHSRLSDSDVAAIQALYGPRLNDPQDAVSPNNTSATATPVVWTGSTTTLAGDITTTRDVDFYKFTTKLIGESDVRIRVKTSGLSFLTPNLQVFRNGHLIASKATNDPFAGDLTFSLGTEYRPGTTFTIRVAGQGGNVFNRGAYQLSLEPTTAGTGTAPIAVGAVIDGGTNDTLDTATPLTSSSGSGSSVHLTGSIEVATDIDYYTFSNLSSGSDHKLFTATVATLDATKLVPIVELVDQSGDPVASSVILNEGGTFTVEAGGEALDDVTTIHLVVTPANPTGTKASGDYVVTANLTTSDMTSFDAITSGSITSDSSTTYIGMNVAEPRLVRFALDTGTLAGSVPTAVGFTIYNSAGHAIFSFADVAGGYLTTGTLWLAQGSYTIVVTARTITGLVPASVAFDLKKLELGDPIDPYDDGSGGGGTTGDPVVTTSPPTPTPPPPLPPVSDPIPDPWANLG